MIDKLSGRVFKFGESISTDHIIPGRYAHLRSNLNELVKHAMEDVSPSFIREVQAGDFIVAGSNFGLGSSREHAPLVIKMAGVGAVIAKSVARIFFRNAINIGLPVLLCNTDQINNHDELEINLGKGIITNKSNSIEITFHKIPAIMQDILNDGGLIPYVQRHGDFEF
jgi:3-isopropylmalate/(R)-2-methylmalate dehydratase small subunit